MQSTSKSIVIRLVQASKKHSRWMFICRDGIGTKEAQMQVKKFSSHKHSSHHWVYETVWLDIPYIVTIDTQDKPYLVMANLVVIQNL